MDLRIQMHGTLPKIEKAEKGGRQEVSSPSSVVCADAALAALDMGRLEDVDYSCEKLLEKAVGRFAMAGL